MKKLMDKLWAPWRISYVKSTKKRGCIFCVRKKHKKNSFIVEHGQFCFVILNIYPYNNGHLMIAPYRHINDVRLLTQEEWQEMLVLTKKYENYLDIILHPNGFNFGINIGRAAGAGVKGHIHMHIVPRWIGDSNFMTTVSNTKVISQGLKDLYKRLKQCKKK